MKAAVAVQRKLLELMYTLYKKQGKYDSNHFNYKTDTQQQVKTSEKK